MLQKLVIKNYAIIDHLVLEPDQQLNTVTGETGAGKSIILGALSLILGERADTSVLINKEEKSVIEGYFDVVGNELLRAAITKAGLDFEEQCIIRREIAVSGKSRAFVNDTPVTLPVLHELTSLLVDLHQQFGHLALEDDSFAMQALDAVAGSTEAAAQYRVAYYRYKSVKQKLADHRERQSLWQKEADYKQYLLDELLQAAVKPGELEHAEQQLKQMSHAERILAVLQSSRLLLEEGEEPLLVALKRTSQQLLGIAEVLPEARHLQERTLSAWAELKDIAAELETLEGNVMLDPELMATLQTRLDTGYKLLKKHGENTTDGLIRLQHQLEQELKASTDLHDAITQLAAEEGSLYTALAAMAAALTAARKQAIPNFCRDVNELLVLVGMPNAKFSIQLAAGDLNAHGADRVDFLLDANRSGQFQLLQKAASGGEMSRIMLCIKSLTAQAMHLPTLIFDEVDTGISGEAARQVGLLLRQLAQRHQVLCITHQPQVAARGTRHFYVYKEEAAAGGRITTRVRQLQPHERVLAIARMIGGEQPSEAALNNARELVG